MPKWSSKSRLALSTAAQPLQDLFNKVVETFDCTVLEGKRSEYQQQLNVLKGVSKTLQSKHVYPLKAPSRAVDVAPWPLEWPRKPSPDYDKQLALFYMFAGYVKATALAMGIRIRWGGDWDGDFDIKDQVFDDLAHFELVD